MSSAALPRGLAFHLCAVQFLAALSWIAYVVYLPRMAASAGLPVAAVGWILFADQLVFAAADLYLGRAADHALRTIGRIGPLLAGVTVASGAVLVALPAIADAAGASGPGWKTLFFLLLLVWAVTSSALRAPALALVAKRTPRPSLPGLAALVAIGNALAAAAAPYLALAAKDHDPVWAFLLSTVTLVAAVAGLAAAERKGLSLTENRSAPEEEKKPSAPPSREAVAGFFAAAALLAVGFQIHNNLNAAVLYRKFAPASELPWLLPVFWIGVNLFALVGAWLARRHGAFTTLTGAVLVGAASTAFAAVAPGLGWLAVSQFLAGGAWGAIMAVLFAHALALGKPGSEGQMAGRLSALLAVAAVVRIGIANMQLPAAHPFVVVALWLPATLWLVAALVLWRTKSNEGPP
ncbi:MAG: MFS transporter [Burkholderiales bacterium]